MGGIARVLKSGKTWTAVLGSALAGVVGGLVQAGAISADLATIIIGVIGSLFGATVIGHAWEDAAKKKIGG